MDDMPTAENFAPFVGEAFRLDDGTLLTLVAVNRPPGAAGAHAFTLILRGAAQPVIAEGMHRLTQASGAAYTLYMMPIYTTERGQQDYQIVFN